VVLQLAADRPHDPGRDVGGVLADDHVVDVQVGGGGQGPGVDELAGGDEDAEQRLAAQLGFVPVGGGEQQLPVDGYGRVHGLVSSSGWAEAASDHLLVRPARGACRSPAVDSRAAVPRWAVGDCRAAAGRSASGSGLAAG